MLTVANMKKFSSQTMPLGALVGKDLAHVFLKGDLS